MIFYSVVGWSILVIALIVFIIRIYGESSCGFEKTTTTPLSLFAVGLGSLIGAVGGGKSSDKMLFYGFAAFAVGIIWYFIRRDNANRGVYVREREKELSQIEVEQSQAVASQNQAEPWAKKYMTTPCPYCGHYKVRWAKWEDKQVSVAFWGGASSKLGTNYKCDNCGRMWE